MREDQFKVLQHFKNISIQVHRIEKNYITMDKGFLDDFPTSIHQGGIDLERIAELMVDISDNFQLMQRMEKYELATLISFTNSITSPATSEFSSTLINEFYSTLFGLDSQYISKDMLTQVVQMYEMLPQKSCLIQLTPQQYVYFLYKNIALTELKAYILIEYSLMIRWVSGQRDLIDEWKTIRLNYGQRAEQSLRQLRILSQQSDRLLWRCDPAKHILNVTYDEVTRLLQGYVENEVDLSKEGSCSKTCPYYQNTTSTACFHQEFCSQQPQCRGRIYNCQVIESDLTVCQSPWKSSRRYEYIQYGTGQRFGKQKSCSRDTNNVESWRRWLFWKCSYCFCLCDDHYNSDRYFNLRETVSDVKANKVVTGVRFVKKNRVFHLQIQQGQLLPRGEINQSTVEWKPVDGYKIDDTNIREGVDYHSMNYKSRGLNLDEITYTNDKAFVVTGVRFQATNGRLNLIVLFSNFDFVKGLLIEPESTRKYQSNSNIEGREKLHLTNLDVPTLSIDSSQPLSKDGQYLEFVNTGMEQDAAQTTIPFIDIQDVVSNHPVPLSGIGIYYKGSLGYGGFVAPKIISYDISPHLPLVTML
ncbi:uncharacterized protein LOC133838719 [Drosophila sulfurigaster albostrigata]|uniref:uncharacterized protein LOC133838719 n=1 Tax=Drosophila sulfurigaster albostrigata TaxID=89887 RepID=UPI002D21B7E8|nr:uncharacterized protein LOC133838719 [Drosophila sulfurigaster albostrigata]